LHAAGGPFPLFYKIGSFYSHYLPGTAAQKLKEPVKSCIKAYSFLLNNKNNTGKREVCADLIALLTHEVKLSSQNARITRKEWKNTE